jgi:hypothetical protein
MVTRNFAQRILFIAFSLYVLLAAGCGGGGGSALPVNATTTGFWAADFTTNQPQPYRINATKVAEGAHCYIYLEQGRSVPQATINAILNEFDNNIYPKDTATFGGEPNPGIDNDPRICILLLDIKDGFNPPVNPGYLAGYFDSGNEYLQSQYAYSNEKEMLYMDTYPATPGSPKFYNALAHEFQHMIHWEQKSHRQGLNDDTWLDEGMSEIAPVYCGYGPNYGRVYTFENAPSDSLTVWGNTINDYGVVYMWAQYVKDRFSSSNPDIFRSMLHNGEIGISSVDAALAPYSLTFASTFRDWAIANYSGNTITWTGHPEWSYTSIDTGLGTHNGITIPGLFPQTKHNLTTLSALDMWSVDYYSYTSTSSPTGTVIWTAGSASDAASFINQGIPTVYSDLVSGAIYTFSATGYLIGSNPTGTNSTAADTVVNTAITQNELNTAQSMNSITHQSTTIKTPKAMLDEANRDPALHQLARQTGEPQHICVHSYFLEQEKLFRAKGAKPPF